MNSGKMSAGHSDTSNRIKTRTVLMVVASTLLNVSAKLTIKKIS